MLKSFHLQSCEWGRNELATRFRVVNTCKSYGCNAEKYHSSQGLEKWNELLSDKLFNGCSKAGELRKVLWICACKIRPFHVHKYSVNLSSGVSERALTTGWILISQLVKKQQSSLNGKKEMFIIHKSSLYIISYSRSKQSKLLEWHAFKYKMTYRKRLWKK